jgi:hypothetical protein
MFAIFGKAASSGQNDVHSIRLNTSLELLMEPLKHQESITVLDLTEGLSNGDRALPMLLLFLSSRKT